VLRARPYNLPITAEYTTPAAAMYWNWEYTAEYYNSIHIIHFTILGRYYNYIYSVYAIMASYAYNIVAVAAVRKGGSIKCIVYII